MPDQKTKLMGLREYSRYRKVRLSTIQEAIKTGRIETIRVNGKTRIDVKIADKAFEENTDPSKQNREPETADPSPPEKRPNLLNARIARETYVARLKKLEFQEKTGELISANRVKVEMFTLARTVRDAVQNVPDRVAAMIAAETDPRKVHDLLTKELKSALQELVNAGRLTEKK